MRIWDKPIDIMMVDSDTAFCRHLGEMLEPVGFTARYLNSIDHAIQHMAERPPNFLVLGFHEDSTIDLPMLQGWLPRAKQTRVVILLPPSLESYEELFRQLGVVQIISRRLNLRQIAQYLLRLAEISHLEDQNYHLRQMLDNRSTYENLMGGSPPMRSLYRLLDQVARTDTPVLITGEKGTELAEVGKAIHFKGKRSLHPMVVVNCAELAEDEVGAAIFGPIGKGEYAFGPSPVNSAFARAGKGSIILNHIEGLSLRAQQRLLDYMHRPFFQNETPGTPHPLARIMTTSGSNLLGAVEEGTFIRELFYRLNIIQVRVPSLRERREDIPMLAMHFLRGLGKTSGQSGVNGTSRSFSSEVVLRLFQYDWPGNLDQLEEVVRAMGEQTECSQIENEHLAECLKSDPAASDALPAPANHGRVDIPLKEAKRIFETEYFKGLLKRTGGNMTLASRQSHVGRPYLYKKIREYGILPEQYR